jgi:Ca2+-binding EF-hand superfamily protein/ankyrin repeat protein
MSDSTYDSLREECVQKTLDNPKNLAGKKELTEQANVAIRAFRKADVDGSGTIDENEMMALAEDMGYPVEDSESTIVKIDIDGSGEVNLTEWVMWWLNRVSCLPNPAKQQEVIAKNTFRKFDIDSSHTLDSSELIELLDALGADFTPNEINEVLQILDSDGNGFIDENEFVDWWTNRATENRKGGGSLLLGKLNKLACKASQLFNTDIFVAAWNNDLNLLKSFIDSDIRIVNGTDESDYGNGWTALHYASYQGHIDIIHELLKNNVNVNKPNNDGFPALFYAAQQGHFSICQILLHNNADPTICGYSLEYDTFMCSVEHIIDYPELIDLFQDHEKCSPPQEILSNNIFGEITHDGLLHFQTPTQRTFTKLPIHSWRIWLYKAMIKNNIDGIIQDNEIGNDDELKADNINDNIVVNTSDASPRTEDKLEFLVRAKYPLHPQSIDVMLDKVWLKRMALEVKRSNDNKLSMDIAPINAMKTQGPTTTISINFYYNVIFKSISKAVGDEKGMNSSTNKK